MRLGFTSHAVPRAYIELPNHINAAMQLVAGRLGMFSSSALGDAGTQLSMSALQTVDHGVGSSLMDDCAVHNIRIKNPVGNPLYELYQQHTRGPLMRKWYAMFSTVRITMAATRRTAACNIRLLRNPLILHHST